MTTGSHSQQVGLTIAYYKPTIDTSASPVYVPDGLHLGEISRPDSYVHTMSVETGYESASISFKDRKDKIEDWIAEGLGRHIEVYNPALERIWEGVVNSFSAQIGPLSVTGGPLMDVVNRCTVVYNPIDPTADPPASGPPQETLTVQDTASQGRYGILDYVFSGGSDTPAGAEQARDTLLADLAEPQRSEQLTPGAGGGPSITLNCLGYYAFLDKYVFNDTTTLTVTITAKIQTALGADPNGIFSTDYSHLDTNAFLVSAREEDYATAWSVIKGMLAIGDVNDDRWLFGIYNDRVAFNSAVPSSQEYQHSIGKRSQRIELYGLGRIVYPWDVRPGKWIFLPDYLIGRSQSSVLREDPRNIFIESLRYTAPYTIEINGQRWGNLPQLLAKKGLGGL